MRTIEEPKLPRVEDRKYHIRCKNKECLALLEVSYNELGFISDQRDGDFFQLICPHCTDHTNISRSCLNKFLV